MTSNKPKVFITHNAIPQPALDYLRDFCEVSQWDKEEVIPKEVLIERAKGKDGIFCILENKINKELLDGLGSQLKIVSTMSVGYDHIDISECAKRNIIVGNTPGCLTETTADLAVAIMLAVARRIPEGIHSAQTGTWGSWAPLYMCGQDLHHSTVGIVGLGRIGAATAKRLSGFGCKILYTGKNPKPEIADPLGAKYVDFDTLLGTSDFVSVHCPLTDQTKLLFNKEVFSKMKKTAIFVNTSRGGLVNQEDLLWALKEKIIYAAGIDVTTPEPLPPSHPLYSLPNCMILPHVGSASLGTRTEMAMMAARNLVAGVTGKDVQHKVESK